MIQMNWVHPPALTSLLPSLHLQQLTSTELFSEASNYTTPEQMSHSLTEPAGS
jgi:hypothetical protein